MMTVGGWGAAARRWPLPPSSSTSSPWTTFTTCWAGVSDVRTSCPTALSFTRSMKARTTLKLTSASRSATRTSRSASWMFSSDSRPRPPSLSKMVCSLVLRESSMGTPTLREHQSKINETAGARRLPAAGRNELHRRPAPLIDPDIDLIEDPALGKPDSRRGLGDVEPRDLGEHRLIPGRGAFRYGHVHLHRHRLRRHPHLAHGVPEASVGQHRVRVVEGVGLVAERNRLARASGTRRHDHEGPVGVRPDDEHRGLWVRAAQSGGAHLRGSRAPRPKRQQETVG